MAIAPLPVAHEPNAFFDEMMKMMKIRSKLFYCLTCYMYQSMDYTFMDVMELAHQSHGPILGATRMSGWCRRG